MAVNTIDYRPTLSTTADTNRNPSPVIWGDCPINELREGEQAGVFFRDDFLSFPITPATTEGNWSQYAQFSSTGGTITAGTGQGGEAAFGSDGDNEGASIRTLSTPFKINRTLGKLWFEARVKSSTVTDTKHGFFVGLMQDVALTATVPITAAGAIADTNIVGFHRLEGDGVHLDTIYKADGVTQVSVQTDAVTIAADTYVKVGMVFEPAADFAIADPTLAGVNKYVLKFYYNGLLLSTSKQIPSAAGTDFPNDIGLGLVFAVLNATASTPGTSTIDWWQCAQLI
jgi:hypothetical protein